jgi:SAM-dependent methyltransferase
MKLDIGCGRNKVEGFVGLDIAPDVGADIVCDIEQGIPLPDNSVDEVHMSHVLEHLREVDMVLAEIARICRPGARIFFRVPDVQHETYHMPTHCQPWSRAWWRDCCGTFEVIQIAEVPDPAGLVVARKYLPTITDEDAMTLLWNCRKELHVTCRAR